jgi:plastocyanin
MGYTKAGRRMRVACIGMALAALAPAAFAAEVTVRVRSNVFVPNDVTINVGDTIVFRNEQGPHEVAADNSSWRSPFGQGWVWRRQFNTPGEVLYFCTVHSTPGQPINAAMNGRINVVGDPPVRLNRGMSGAWFEPATSGQGMLLDVDPASRTVFVAWFTYEQAATAAPGGAPKIGASDNRWLTAQGNYPEGSNSTTMSLFKTGGGRFDQGGGTTTTPAGTLTLEFTSCNTAIATYSLIPEFLTDTIALTRVLPGTESDCQARQ